MDKEKSNSMCGFQNINWRSSIKVLARALFVKTVGEQHYHNFEYSFGGDNSLYIYTKRDEEKLMQCQLAGVILVSVPYWWDSTVSSLQDIISETTGDKLEENLFENCKLYSLNSR